MVTMGAAGGVCADSYAGRGCCGGDICAGPWAGAGAGSLGGAAVAMGPAVGCRAVALTGAELVRTWGGWCRWDRPAEEDRRGRDRNADAAELVQGRGRSRRR